MFYNNRFYSFIYLKNKKTIYVIIKTFLSFYKNFFALFHKKLFYIFIKTFVSVYYKYDGISLSLIKDLDLSLKESRDIIEFLARKRNVSNYEPMTNEELLSTLKKKTYLPQKPLKLGKRKNTQILTTQKPLKIAKLEINQNPTPKTNKIFKTKNNPKFNTSKNPKIGKT